MHDVLDPRDLVPDEAEQLLTSGYPAAALLEEARQAAAAGDLGALGAVAKALADLGRDPEWTFDEPSEKETLVEHLNALEDRPPGESVTDRVIGAWLGRCVANAMGKPVEGLRRDEVEIYLTAVGHWPQTGFIPLIDPLPAGVSHLHESAPESAAGCFTAIPRDDDLDWTILGLHLLETHGRALSTENIAAAWLDRLPFTQTFTAERAAYRNLIRGLRTPETATVENPYREWIGALIRTDIYGYVHPGAPGAAARMALTDAVLSHTGNGIYGAMWAAALVAEALVSDDAHDALHRALAVVPRRSRLYSALDSVLGLYGRGASAVDALAWIDTELGDYNWVHTINNAAIISFALLWGDGFAGTVALAVSAGRDTDSTAATVGSVFGALHGSAAIPEALVAPGQGIVRSAVRGFDRVSVTELAERTESVRLTLAGEAS